MEVLQVYWLVFNVNLVTNSVPAITFEAPGDLMYAARIGLLPFEKSPSLDEFLSKLPIYHFGNDGDPIFLGQCQGAVSACYWGGYAMESKCHVGKVCMYKAEKSADIRNHGIETIKKLIEDGQVEECLVQTLCTDCESWSFELK